MANMIWAPEAYYVIQDISDGKRNLVVVAEADNKVDAERFIRDKELRECEVYKEQGEELYRVICERRYANTETGR
jgi:hypothetical protein